MVFVIVLPNRIRSSTMRGLRAREYMPHGAGWLVWGNPMTQPVHTVAPRHLPDGGSSKRTLEGVIAKLKMHIERLRPIGRSTKAK